MSAGNNLGRRVLFASLVGATMAGLIGLAARRFRPAASALVDAVLLACFIVTLPWIVIGFWNAMIGFLIMRLSHDPVATVCPIAARVRGDEAITASTAILLCTRNETPDRMIRNLDPLIAGLAASAAAERFHLYVLSDTSNAEIAATEEACFAALAAQWKRQLGHHLSAARRQ